MVKNFFLVANRLQTIIKELGISPTDLSTSAAETLDFLSEYACLMNLSNTDFERYGMHNIYVKFT